MTPHLRATTVMLPGPPDLLAQAGDDGLLFRHEGGGVAARGEALRIELPAGLRDPQALAAVCETLASIPCDGDPGLPGTGPVAIGALPFDPSEPGHLVVPEHLFGRDGDTGWMTVVEPLEAGPGAVHLGPAVREPADPPDAFGLEPTMTHAEWREAVSQTLLVLEAGELEKVVLARRVDVSANRPFVISDVLERLAALYPSCMIFNVEGFLGASPELLLRRRGDLVESHPLAGTVARSGDQRGDESLVAGLMASPKARREHQVVVDSIASALEVHCAGLDVPTTPSVLGLRNVSHLATLITGHLRPGPVPPSALELVALIHPTPAVGGTPTEAALDHMAKVEGFDRGRYAGPVGWLDSRGDGCFALGIRSAEVEGTRARIFAGNGLVRGSDPDAELAETQLKLQALLAALVRP